MGASGAVQTAVTVNPVQGVPGQLYDLAEQCDTVSRVAANDIPFGAYVKCTASGQCDLPSASGDITNADGGIAIIAGAMATGVGYKQGDVVTVLKKGRVWVNSEDAATERAIPYFRYTANVTPTRTPGGNAGGSDAGKNVQLPGTIYYQGNAAAGLAVVGINLP